MESEFISLCDYNLFVSAELYTQYYIAIKEINNPLMKSRSSQNTAPKPFNRFKKPNEQTYFVPQQKLSIGRLSIEKNLDQIDENLPVVFGSGRQQYPSIKLDVNQYKNEVHEILEETIEEKKRQQEEAKQNKNKPVSKIKQFLNTSQKQEIIEHDTEANRLSYQIVSISL